MPSTTGPSSRASSTSAGSRITSYNVCYTKLLRAARIHYLSADALDHASWGDLVDTLRGYETRTRVVYLATAPALFGAIAEGFRENGLINRNNFV